MFDFLLPNKKELDALFRALAGNPLLAALLLISPLEAFKFLNIVPKFLGALLPTAGEDAQLAQSLVQALREGRTTLERPQIIQPVAIAEPPMPVAQPLDLALAPAVTLAISKATLQHALQLYERSNYQGREFVFPAQSWLDVATRGESIGLDLANDHAQIIARLQGTMVFKLAGKQFDLKSQRVSFPIELSVLAVLVVDSENRLFLRVSNGAVSIGSTPLPARIANDLVAKITETIHSIPLVQVPTSFEIPGDPPAALALRLANIGITGDGLTLAFQLDD
jgi:hypothetical protein